MKGTNPYVDQGIDIRLCLGSCPMDTYSNDIDSDIEYISIPAWRMENGQLIAIRDMTTSHIKNCINMIYRANKSWRIKYLKYLDEELKRREQK